MSEDIPLRRKNGHFRLGILNELHQNITKSVVMVNEISFRLKHCFPPKKMKVTWHVLYRNAVNGVTSAPLGIRCMKVLVLYRNAVNGVTSAPLGIRCMKVLAIHSLQKVSKRNPKIYQQIVDQLQCPQNVNIMDCYTTLMSPWIRYMLSHRRHL
ncbi:unnamed protein product [Mytilus coruscus]|uniref:Uncharacterized protein n=1 Tax=Mytilus coruscus TaxID=42192 RepID=A0A6J8DW03_MYTCO|nr:unnamed protein product [Mytilus coruscus]